jgi:hypothetical protein
MRSWRIPRRAHGRGVGRSRHAGGALVLLTAAALAMCVGLFGAASASARHGVMGRAAQSVLACDRGTLKAAVSLPSVTVTAAARNTSGVFTAPTTPPLSDTPGSPWTDLPSYCQVILTETDSAGNAMHHVLWLPDVWNRRFMGVGGSGYTCGIGYAELAAAIRAGYASASTDCGVEANPRDGSFALRSDNTLNLPVIENFASAGIHAMTVAGKAVTRAYYARTPAYSYFNGCSTGGRNGLMEAQRYPADYEGIVAAAPAINWTRFIPAEIWPQLVMNEGNDSLPTCKQQAFTDAVIDACGGADGVIQDPAHCRWRPEQLVGLMTPCGTITTTDAAVVAKIWQGPASTDGRPLWHGLLPGTPFDGLAATTTDASEVTTGNPFPITVDYLGKWLLQNPFPVTVDYLGKWLLQNPSWDWHTLTYEQFDQLFAQSVRQYADVIATDDPDLSRFRARGGKLIIWHGLADELIFAQGSVDYYNRVVRTLGRRTTNSFARLFLAPGALHCRPGNGPAPAVATDDDMSPASPVPAVVAWVEKRQPPRSLLAIKTNPATGVVTSSRELPAAGPLQGRQPQSRHELHLHRAALAALGAGWRCLRIRC